jgi:Fe2+ transport system protein B
MLHFGGMRRLRAEELGFSARVPAICAVRNIHDQRKWLVSIEVIPHTRL